MVLQGLRDNYTSTQEISQLISIFFTTFFVPLFFTLLLIKQNYLPLICLLAFFQSFSFLNIEAPFFFSLNPFIAISLLLICRTLQYRAITIFPKDNTTSYLFCFSIYSTLITFVVPVLGLDFLVLPSRDGIDTRLLQPLQLTYSNLSHISYLWIFYFLHLLLKTSSVSSTSHLFLKSRLVHKSLVTVFILNLLLACWQYLGNLGIHYPLQLFIQNQPISSVLVQANFPIYRISGIFTEPSLLASFLVFSIIYLKFSPYSSPLLTSILFPSSFFFLLLSQSFTGLAAVLPVLFIVLFSASRRIYLSPLFNVLRIASLPLLFFLFFYFFSSVQNTISSPVTSKLVTESFQNRSYSDFIALSLFKDSIFLGIGLSSTDCSSFLISLFTSTGVIGAYFFLRYFYSLRPNSDLYSTLSLPSAILVEYRALWFATSLYLLVICLSVSDICYFPLWGAFLILYTSIPLPKGKV